ncbi:MAG: purine-binding chemotaxis protein CheW [Deltaproteobacteria bacterium]|nr:purine-binding chemotaxis protein CheW [Deltaproteobacteria bacterium]
MTRPIESVVQLATFRVGQEDYALDIMQIREIVNPLPVRAVHNAPTFVEGLIELRGSVIPVIDLRKRFGLEATAATRRTKFVVVNHKGRAIALVVDEVGVLRVPEKEIRDAPGYVSDGGASYFSGVVSRDGKMYLVLKIEEILGSSATIDVAAIRRGVGEPPQ